VLGDDLGRIKVTFEISDRAAGELAEYTQWVEESSGMTASEAKFKTVEFAFREVFRRDRVWQAKRRTAAESPPTAPAVSPAAPTSATRAPSPSLPPPTPRDPRTSA
jgi:hypothetical protein